MTYPKDVTENSLSALGLRAKKEALWGERFSEDNQLTLRTHRAISWLGRAEQETDDYDAAFIYYWIAFNASYAREIQRVKTQAERGRLAKYFSQIVNLDSEGRIFDAVWNIFADAIRVLLDNKFVFQPFWYYHNGVDHYDDWERRFQASRNSAARALGRAETATVLSILFDRLYVLRNQLMHGGATWNSSLSRDQMRDGVRIMALLVPLFIDVMLDNPTEQWGPPYYPIVN